MPPRRPDSDRTGAFLPLSPQDFEVLLVLSETALHGYGIVQASEQSGGPRVLELGSLYRIIGRLLDNGLIEEVAAPGTASADGRRRRYYAATALGRGVARAEASRLRALLSSERVTRLAPERGGG
jgi:DNA-binding PadR family transcriptional regulator